MTTAKREVVVAGWDGATQPMYRYRNKDGSIDRDSIVANEDRPDYHGMPDDHPRDDELVVHQAFETDELSQRMAQRVFAGDWDADGTTSVYLPREFGRKLLEKRGWMIEEQGYSRGNRRPHLRQTVYRAPDGETYYGMDEALQIALVAEVI